MFFKYKKFEYYPDSCKIFVRTMVEQLEHLIIYSFLELGTQGKSNFHKILLVFSKIISLLCGFYIYNKLLLYCKFTKLTKIYYCCIGYAGIRGG